MDGNLFKGTTHQVY